MSIEILSLFIVLHKEPIVLFFIPEMLILTWRDTMTLLNGPMPEAMLIFRYELILDVRDGAHS